VERAVNNDVRTPEHGGELDSLHQAFAHYVLDTRIERVQWYTTKWTMNPPAAGVALEQCVDLVGAALLLVSIIEQVWIGSVTDLKIAITLEEPVTVNMQIGNVGCSTQHVAFRGIHEAFALLIVYHSMPLCTIDNYRESPET
jgi:hypothetical protein